MAMVLDAFASYVTDLLKQMAEEELRMLLGVSGEIDKLGVKLGDLKKFLADAERRRITDELVQGWVGELKDAMYDATDILDDCKLKAMECCQPSVADKGGCCNLNLLLFCLRNPLFSHNIGSRIMKLNQRLDDINKRGKTYKFIKLEAYKERRPIQPLSTMTDPVLEISSVVGEKIQDDTRELVHLLTEEEGDSNSNVGTMVVAVVGVGGIGKTTLAKNVFNDDTIQHSYDKMIWLSVTQEFSEVGLLTTAITATKGVLPAATGAQDRSILVPALVDSIRNLKIFLVLDDMWSAREWNNLLKAPFSYAARGSRVLLTTRDERVARGMNAREPFHHVDRLENGYAWSLLKKQVISSKANEPDVEVLKDVGMRIIEKCDGLPLAIKIMGGLLCQKERNRLDWEKVLNASIWSVSGLPKELNHAVYLSYDDLPPHLKQCFLHYSLVISKGRFGRDAVVDLWVAEGFVQGRPTELPELGKEYYEELISRNLIEPDEYRVDHDLCSMHDVVRSFALYIARDEALEATNGQMNLDSHKFRRLCLESTEEENLEWSVLQKQKSLRMLMIVGSIDLKAGDSLGTFSYLRILIIIETKISTVVVDSLSKLKHLRILWLEDTDISRLPDDIGKMKFLEDFAIMNCENMVQLPGSIVKLKQLKSLTLTGTNLKGIPKGFCSLTDLQKLYAFPAHIDNGSKQQDWCSLEELGPLSQLRFLTLQGLENVPDSSSAKKAALGDKKSLVLLYLECASKLGDDGLVKEEQRVSPEDKQRIEAVFDELCPPPCVDELGIIGYFGHRLPNWLMSGASLLSLRFLFMEDLACCTQLPGGLCHLPFLQLLQIKRAPAIKHVGPEFIVHHRHSSQVGAASPRFPRLSKMELLQMVEWEEWEWEEQVQAMPALESLHINGCKLRRLPPGLVTHTRALNKLYIYSVQHLKSLENFESVVELQAFDNPDLERVANLPKLQKLVIVNCPKIKEVEDVPALQRLVLKDYDMETLPEYPKHVNPRHLQLDCTLELLTAMAIGQSGPEWDKFSHIHQVKAYARDGDNARQWYVVYVKKDLSYSLDTNIVLTSSKPSGGLEVA